MDNEHHRIPYGLSEGHPDYTAGYEDDSPTLSEMLLGVFSLILFTLIFALFLPALNYYIENSENITYAQAVLGRIRDEY